MSRPNNEPDFGDISEDQSPDEIAEQVEAAYKRVEDDEPRPHMPYEVP